MAISMNDTLVLAAQMSIEGKMFKVVSNKHVPYSNSADVLATITATRRHIGQLFRVANGAAIEDWEFVGGIADENLVKRVSGGGVQSVVAGTGITVDTTDPLNPIVGASGSAYSRPYRVLSGQINQVGTSAPTFIEWENTTGSSYTFSRIGVGHYRLTFGDLTNVGNPSTPKQYAVMPDGLTGTVKYLQIVFVPGVGLGYFDLYYGEPGTLSDDMPAIYFSLEFLLGAA